MRQKLFALLATVLVFAAGVNAQNVKVSGTVSDNAGPVIGASILVKGTTEGTITDVDGKYSISVPANATLVVSFIGYQTEEVAVGGRSVVNVTLKEDSELLAESVVLGYGVATKKKDLSAAVGVVASPEKLAAHPVTSTEAMLQGQIPGVTIQANGGSPTSTPSIVIRGTGSNGSEPVLWVVDGVPGAPINSMNDIESIVVLKDAASAAIYGAQAGAGGVILVTTKKAQQGLSVSYDGLVGVRQASNLIQPLNAEEELAMHTQAYANAGSALPDGWNPSKNPWITTTRTNWMDEIFRTALYHRHNVSINAGTENFKNKISFSSDNNDGVLIGTYKKTMGINYRGEFKVNNWIKLTEDFSWSERNERGVDTDSGYTGAVLSAIYMPSSATVHQYDGTGFGGTTTEDPEYIAKYGDNYASAHGESVNPVRSLTANNMYNRYNKIYTSTGLEIANIVKGLKFNSRFTYMLNNSFVKNFSYQRTEVGKPDRSNSLSYSTNREDKWLTENTLSFDRTFGKHSISALVNATTDHYENRYFDASGNTFADESISLQYLSYAATRNATDRLDGPDANVAFLGRIAYSYDDRYFVTGSFRRDIAGRLPNEHNAGNFPAVTGAWKISSEPFFQKNDVLNLLKLRASWGRIGNLSSIGMNYKSAVLSKDTWNNQTNVYGIESGAAGSGAIGAYYTLNKALNNNLTWETSEQFDAGLDINMFSERLSMSFDFYNKRTFNLIQDQPTGWPQTIGVSAMKVNLGEVMNRGFEMQIGWADKVGNWSYFVNGNMGYNKNWVSDIGIDEGNGVWTYSDNYRNLPYIYRTCEGGPIRQYYLIECLGIFQSQAEIDAYVKDGKKIQPNAKPGDLKFKDRNNDGTINDSDREYWGNSTPDLTYAFNLGFSWKNLSLSAMFQGVQGAQAAYVGKYSIYSDMEQCYNRAKGIMNAWTPTNTNTDIPRVSVADNNGNFTTPSTWYLEDASYLRLKNVTLSYDLTKALRKASHFGDRGSSLQVYFSGENLFTITKYSGMDPECAGWDALKYPVSRVLSFGVKLTY